MAKVRVMYWKEIPVQVQATAGTEQVSKPLDERFQQGADAISMFDAAQEPTSTSWGGVGASTGMSMGRPRRPRSRLQSGTTRVFPVTSLRGYAIYTNEDCETQRPAPSTVG